MILKKAEKRYNFKKTIKDIELIRLRIHALNKKTFKAENILNEINEIRQLVKRVKHSMPFNADLSAFTSILDSLEKQVMEKIEKEVKRIESTRARD